MKRVILGVGLAMGIVSGLQGGWSEQPGSVVPATQELRGFGRVTTLSSTWTGAPGQQVWATTFRCSSPTNAATVLGKLLADLELSTGVQRVTVGGLPALATPDGTHYAGCLAGAEARVLAASSAAVLADFAAAQPAQVAGAVAAAPYPAYLDRFDRYGWGCYGMGGFNGFHDWMKGADGKATPKDPAEDVAFMIAQQFRFEPWLDPTAFDTSDGIQQNTEAEWFIKLLTDAHMPFSFRVYGNAGAADWTQRRFPEYADQPASFLMSGWHGPQRFWKPQPHFTWFDRDIHRYLAVQTMDMMRPYADNPLLLGWMHPHGELVHTPWYDLHDDYSLTAQRAWQAYLRGQHLTLADVSRLYGKSAEPFGAWEQVPVPEFATFAGLDGQVQSLAGTWFWRREREQAKKEDETFPGLAEKWYQQPLDPALWKAVALPGGDALYDVLPQSLGWFSTTWFRRSFTLTPAQLRTTPVYLYWFPQSHGIVHSGATGKYHQVFINGVAAGGVGSWGALDVTKLLQAGNNDIAVQLFGPVWDGRIFLSTAAPVVYPYLGADRNQLFLLWQDWHIAAKYLAWRDVLDGMRQVDPVRPIKFMAPLRFGADRWLQLAHDWGAFGHFTGEGMWYFPWYKRYGFLYDVPGTSETAGPPSPERPVADQFDAFRRVFLAGLNAHDPVFLAQTYTRTPALRAWWETHAPVLHRLGKYDLDGPQVLLYRRSFPPDCEFAPAPFPKLGNATREIQNAWDWDLGRGTLQTLGQSCLYLDDGGLTDGKMVGYPLLIDSGNETMPDTAVDAIAAWVKAGGTFVALPFTGRNRPLAPDTWPIARLTGCTVAKQRVPGTGTVTIAKDQQVLAALAGRSFPDAGASLDYIGNNHNLLSTELAPGPDCDVLATFDNGQPAIVRHRLGAGSVIVLGSAFWRQSHDANGLWWPAPLETEFIADLLHGLGFPAAACTTDDRLVWPQPYRSNNGLDAVTCLVSWHDDQEVTVTVRLRLPARPAALTSYGVDGTQPLPFTWDDGVATARVTLPAKEVKVIAASVYGPRAALDHWWHYQQRMWHALAQPSLDFAPYRTGKWQDPTLDLRAGGGELSTHDPATSVATWTPCPVSVLNFFGATPGQPVWLRKRFQVPPEWAATGGRVYLISGAWAGPQYLGSARLTLNGQQLHDFPGTNFQEFDVTRLLQDGTNEVQIAFKGDQPYQGLCGCLYLYHWTPPAQKLDLAGAWRAQDAAGNAQPVTFPGPASGWAPARDVPIPLAWAGKYQVRLYLEGGSRDTAGVLVNGQLVRRHHHWLGTRCDIDITRFLTFGADNHLELVNVDGGEPRDPKRPPKWNLRTVALHLYPTPTD